MSVLVDKILALHAALDDAEIPHAFGGALALAWCTERARGTIDIDLNVFVDGHRERDLGAPLTDASVVHIIPAVAGGSLLRPS